MNILFLTNELRYTCGVTNHLLNLAGGLSQSSKYKIFIITGGGNGIDRFNGMNAEVLSDDKFLHGNRSSVNYISAVNLLSKFIGKNKINIVHSHSHYAANIASLASKLKQTSKVQTNHGLLEGTGKLKHFSADKYVAINQHIYDHIIKNKIANPDDVKFIRCGIPVPPKPAVKAANPIKVMAASRFIPKKGLDIYIKAVSKIPKDIKLKAEFSLAGEGEEENNLKKLNEELESGVKFPGRVENLPGLLKDNHIFVFTSRSKNEGFPAVITEAGANNNLVITSDFPGASSVLENGFDCLVYNIDNAESLALQISNAISNYSAQTGIAGRFYNKVKELYSLEQMITKHEELYRECLTA